MTQLRPRDVLTQHLDLLELLGNGATPLGGYLDKVAQFDGVVGEQTRIAPHLAQDVRNARAYLIAEHMTAQINARAAGMSEITRVGIEEYRPSRPQGFVVFEEPLRYIEVRGREQIIHVLTWGTTTNSVDGATGWLVQTYNDLDREPDEIAAMDVARGARRVIGRWHGISTYFLPRDMRVGPEFNQPTAEHLERLKSEGVDGCPVRNMHRHVIALWALLNETISVHTTHGRESFDRPTARWAKRRKLPTEVTVVTLRRAAQPVQSPGTGTPLDHRVWVDGFRRRYWCGSGADRHQEWRNVGGHWRGPEGAPVENRPKVDRLSR